MPKVPQPCMGGMLLAEMWDQFLRACGDAAFRHTAFEVSPNSAGSSLSFVVDFERWPREVFGIKCSAPIMDSGVLLVTAVDRGCCVEAWNDRCAVRKQPWKRLHLCAAILSVNGVMGDARRMSHVLSKSLHAVLVACNPPSLHDATSTLRVIRAAAPPPIGEPFWARALRQHASAVCGYDIKAPDPSGNIAQL